MEDENRSIRRGTDDEDIEHSSDEESGGDYKAENTFIDQSQSPTRSLPSSSSGMNNDDWASQGKGGKRNTNLSNSDDHGSKARGGSLGREHFHSRAAEASRERQRIMEKHLRVQEEERSAPKTRRDIGSDSEEKSYDGTSDDYDDDDYDERDDDDGGSYYSEEEEEDIRQQEEDFRRRRAQDRQSTARDQYAAEHKPGADMAADEKNDRAREKSKRSAKGTTPDAKGETNVSSNPGNIAPFTEPHGKIRPGKDGLFDYTDIFSSTYRELKNFLLRPVTRGCVTRCYIERNRRGRNMFAPFYSLCADLEDGTGRELVVCKKLFKSGFGTSHYVFSLKSEDLHRTRERRSRLFVGKLRQAASGESYTLYDNGAQAAPGDENGGDEDYEEEDEFTALAKVSSSTSAGPSKAAKEESSLYRKEHAIVHFSSFERPTPQKGMEVCIPNPTYEPCAEGSLKEEVGTKRSMARRFQVMRHEGKQNELYSSSLFVLHEKQSRYDPLSSCLVDFKGRACMASRRNFQIVQSIADGKPPSNRTSGPPPTQQDSEFILQMGKIAEECYNMDVKYPLSIFQAFAICIARFDAKLKKN